MQNTQNKKFFTTRKLVLAAMLVALSVVLSTLRISLSEGLKFSFSQTPIIIAGVLLGPWWGLIVGGLSDIVGFIAIPTGAYIPLFTVRAALIGLIPGLFMWYIFKGKLVPAVIVSVIIDMLIVNGVFGSYIMTTFLSSKSFYGWIIARLPLQLIMCVIQPIIVITLCKILQKVSVASGNIKVPEEVSSETSKDSTDNE